MRINNNIMAMNTHRQYGINNTNVSSSVEKLSSGYRINRAGDDAAGLAISEKMRAQIRGLTMASKNSQDAISLVQTAEGALQTTHDILQRMREIAVQSSSDTNESTIDRAALEKEFQALIKEIDDTADKTAFNDQKLIDGTFAGNGVTTTKAGVSATTTTGASVASTVAAGDYTVAYTYTDAVTVAAAANVSAAASANTKVASATTVLAGNTGSAINGTYTVIAKQDGTNDNVIYELQDSGGNVVGISTPVAVVSNTAQSAATINLNSSIGGGTLTITPTLGTTTGDTTWAAFDAQFEEFTVTFVGGADVGAAKAEMIVTAPDNSTSSVALTAGMTSATAGGVTISFENALTAITNAATLATAVGTAPTSVVVTQEAKTIAGADFIVQTGANKGDELAITIKNMDATALKVKAASVSSQTNASAAIETVNDAINEVSSQRADLGALQNRLEFKISNLDTSAENLQSAESRIRDLDMAKEMTEFTKNNILSQAATAMLAQANSLPQGVLQLLG